MADRVGQQLGYYRLLRKIGQGAFAEVYLGEHQYLERLAAIKVLHVQIEPKTQEQFRREARTIAHLQHPHILQVLEFGIDDQTPYLVMEYTPGGTLRSRHPKGTRLPLEQIVIYVKQIASALDYAHQQRVIHRDIKPDNLLLNAKDEIVLSDFGLAVVQRTLDSLSTQNPAGTPLYMAPEQIQRKPCAASDQYALGIMVYEWLVGEAPFRGALFEVFSQHLYQPPPSLRERLPGLPLAVEEAVFKALAKDPAQRFACVRDFASALKDACDATQPLTLPGLPKERTPEPTVSYSTQFVPPSTVREQEGSSSPAQPMLVTLPSKEQVKEAVPLSATSPVMPRQTHSTQVKPSLAQSNRQRFLRRVRAFWIEGVLEHSLHGAALIALGLQEQLDALANPWNLVLQHPDTAPRSFPLGTRITEVYDAANGELLILGAPGSGKTTLLLELAHDLLDCAEQDEQHLMPVVFPLSSWAAKQLRLTEWMVEELVDKYDVPRKLARAWVETNQILPLLDGLDEVALEKRTACIEAINTYHQEHAFLPLVVTSRSADYLAQTERVRLTSAVTVQSLTQQQVDDYLARGGEALWALRVALHQDAALRELTSSPLMLSILTLTYHDMPLEELLRGGIAPTRQQIFETYVNRMLTRRRTDPHFSVQQTIQWLTWLARQMKQHNRTQFYIEQLQPTWLKDRRAYITYRCILVGLLELSIGSFSLLSGPFSLLFGLLAGSFPVLVIELLAGLLIGLFKRTIEIRPVELITWSWRAIKQGLLIGLLVGLATGLFVGYTRWLSKDAIQIGADISVHWYLGADIGVIWYHYAHVPLPSWITHGLASWIINGLINGLITSLPVGLVTALFRGPSGARIDEQNRFGPNQGIWHSARNGGIFALISLAINVLIYLALLSSFITRTGYSAYAPLNSLVNSSELALPLLPVTIWNFISGVVILVLPLMVLFMGLRMGGAAAFQHVVLRVLLWSSGSIPWKYPQFLDYATERILLRKVGGGYIFIHRMLLDYLASLNTAPTPDAARAKKEQAEPAS